MVEVAYRQAIELRPSITWLWNKLGLLLSEQKRFEEAEHAYSHALELDSSQSKFWQERQLEPKIARCVLRARDALTRGQEADLTQALDTLLHPITHIFFFFKNNNLAAGVLLMWHRGAAPRGTERASKPTSIEVKLIKMLISWANPVRFGLWPPLAEKMCVMG